MSVTTERTSSARADDDAVPAERLWRLSVVDYHAMLRVGVLKDGDPVELLEGLLVAKMPKNPPHGIATYSARSALQSLVPDGWYVDEQAPISTEDSEPEPDVLIVRGTRRQYSNRHPGPRDLALVVEVADATLERDRGLKKRLYARAGIAIYWLVNLVERRIEVYTDPTGPTTTPDCRNRQDFSPAEAVPVLLDGREIGRVSVASILP